ncbi:HEPN domain-containing protein [Candidatus Woesearchaeota archaeon]|nr:HEPN domain-containing protein [Candidatus Woesearchaeota archaeon]
MADIDWCKQQRNGIELVEPNDNLAKAYIKKAEDSLSASLNLDNNKDWKISSLYYTMYFSVYAVLLKIGIKCEIHSCTIAFAEHILKDYFKPEEIEILKKSMKARIDVQYYTDRNISDSLYQKMIKNAPIFIARCKDIITRFTEQDISRIRKDF